MMLFAEIGLFLLFRERLVERPGPKALQVHRHEAESQRFQCIDHLRPHGLGYDLGHVLWGNFDAGDVIVMAPSSEKRSG